MPLSPPLVLEAGSVPRVLEIPQLEWLNPNLGLTRDLGARHSSPLANKVRSSSMLRGRKDYGMIAWAPLALVIGFEPDASPSV